MSDVSATEGGTVTFTVSMPEASAETVTVDYATADDTAVAGVDYTPTAGTLTFAPGQTSQTVTVALLQDSLAEADETFLLKLSGAVNALILDGSGQATILDDDPRPVVSIGDAPHVTEGDSGTRDAVFTVSLSVASAETVTVTYESRDDDAVGGLDYVSASGILSIPPGTRA